MKSVVFALLFIILLWYFTIRYMPEYFVDQTWAVTATYQGFYEMDKNTVDVLFFGSSAGVRGFIPQELYNNYGMTSYNLSCEQQNMVSSYYWLCEALRYQDPSVVVLESKFIFEKDKGKLQDAWFRKAFNHMRFSSVKREAISVSCELVNLQAEEDHRIDKQSVISWYLPIIRYHTRWEETGRAEGFQYYLKMSKIHDLKGFAPVSVRTSDEFTPIVEDETIDSAVTSEVEVEYLNKIVDLCYDEGIEVILTYNPSTTDTVAKYNALRQYADRRNVAFIDFNLESVLTEMSYDYNQDNEGSTHVNFWGAQKLTNYIGQYLLENNLVQERYSRQFEETRNAYEVVKADCGLRRTNDIDGYLEKLIEQKERYDVFLAVKDDATRYLGDKTIELLREMGLDANLRGQFQCCYLAIITGGRVAVERAGYTLLEEAGTFSRECSYYLKSGGYHYDNACSIMINGSEYARNGRGLNIVVYDHVNNTVVDSVVFDTWAEENTITPTSR